MSVRIMEHAIPKPVFLDADPARKRWRFAEGTLRNQPRIRQSEAAMNNGYVEFLWLGGMTNRPRFRLYALPITL
jgi:hypothetical protein